MSMPRAWYNSRVGSAKMGPWNPVVSNQISEPWQDEWVKHLKITSITLDRVPFATTDDHKLGTGFFHGFLAHGSKLRNICLIFKVRMLPVYC